MKKIKSCFILLSLLLLYFLCLLPSYNSLDNPSGIFLISSPQGWIDAGFNYSSQPIYNNQGLTDFYMPIALKKEDVNKLERKDVEHTFYNWNTNFTERLRSVTFEILESSTYYVVLYHMMVYASNKTFNIDFVPKIKGEELHRFAWWNSTYHYYTEVFVNHNYIGSDLLNFPVLVRINSTLGALCDNGASIRFVNDGNSSEYFFEIDSWSSGDSYIWVNLTQVDGEGDTMFLMYYNNSASVEKSQPWFVWDTNYIYVQHFSGNSLPTLKDSSVYNTSVSTIYSDPDFNCTGQIGNSTYFDSTDDCLILNDNNNLDIETDATFELFFKPVHTWADTGTYRAICKMKLSGAPYRGYIIQSDENRIYGYTDAGVGYFVISNSANIVPNSWYYVGVTYTENASNSKVFLNTSDITWLSSSRVSYATSDNLFVGAGDLYSGETMSYFDEVRISKIVRSDNWIKASYNASRYSDFCYFGSTYEYIPPSQYPVNVTLINLINNSVTFPLYQNNITMYIYDDNGETFNFSIWFNNNSVSYINVGSDFYYVYFPYCLTPLKNYHLCVNTSDGLFYTNYMYNFTTGNISGDIDMSTLMLGMSIENTQLFILILLVLWTFFITKTIEDRNDNKTMFGIIQFALSIPLSICLAVVSLSFAFGFVLVFIIPVSSLFLLSYGYFEDKKGRK